MKLTMQTNKGSVAVAVVIIIVLAVAGYMFWQGGSGSQDTKDKASVDVVSDNLSAELDAATAGDNSIELGKIDAEF